MREKPKIQKVESSQGFAPKLGDNAFGTTWEGEKAKNANGSISIEANHQTKSGCPNPLSEVYMIDCLCVPEDLPKL